MSSVAYKNFTVPQGYSLVSFDIISLFTSIPQTLALVSVESAIKEDATLNDRTSLNFESILKLCELCIRANFFQYDGKVYKQISGLPMGSPISVVVAELTLQMLEKDILSYDNSTILIWKRYIDDCLAVIKTSEIDNFLQYINSLNQKIQFTVELENDNCLSFLDIKILKQLNGRLKFKVYRKPSSNDRYLDYSSYNPLSHKINTITALQRRAYTICSDENSKSEELVKVQRDLVHNGYPKSLINKCEAKITKPINRTSSDIGKIYIVAPYLKSISEATNKILRKYNVELRSKNTNTLKNKLCHLKDSRLNEEKRNIIYQINCNNCSAVYIGESGRNMEIRLKEHERDFRNMKMNNNMFQHMSETNHTFDLKNFKILATEKNRFPRKIIEAAFSKFNENSINRKVDIPDCFSNNIKKALFKSS